LSSPVQNSGPLLKKPVNVDGFIWKNFAGVKGLLFAIIVDLSYHFYHIKSIWLIRRSTKCRNQTQLAGWNMDKTGCLPRILQI